MILLLFPPRIVQFNITIVNERLYKWFHPFVNFLFRMQEQELQMPTLWSFQEASSRFRQGQVAPDTPKSWWPEDLSWSQDGRQPLPEGLDTTFKGFQLMGQKAGWILTISVMFVTISCLWDLQVTTLYCLFR